MKRAPGTFAATALVIASMIGTGVFTSLGFQLPDLTSGPQILVLWALGGIIALCGALCYSAVAEALPRSGGEHHFLTELYHPSLGFMAGILSAIVGFAAPTAITAIAFGEYLHKALPSVPVQAAAVVVILLGSAAHAISSRTSARVQLAATGLKLLLILLFLGAVILLPGEGDIRWTPEPATDFAGILQPAFAISLFFVFYSYSGWNAAVYGLEEWDQPERTVRRALIGGTLVVTLLYLALNAAFLRAAPVEALRGEVAVGEISARHLFGDRAAAPISLLFAVGLFASVSAMLWAGPRVLAAIGRSTPALRLLKPRKEAPVVALGLQTALALGFVFATGFRELVTYTQTGLALCTLLTVAGLFRLRDRVNLGRLMLPIVVFLAMTLFVVIRSLAADPVPTLAGLATAVGVAIAGYFLTHRSPS
ncbi:APC family permease [Haloferula sp. A504]|uniref:APC family permease n=1 Tax=Haloferula sp. A504 TaxID=3373601 RepID=UPI0031C47CA8|nr:amino acid permease [Verrucomicrobiaceae bacterium E54]